MASTQVAAHPLAAFKDKLFTCIDRISAVLPEHKKHDAERHVQRCWLYFIRTPLLHGCSVDSFVQCCLDAAELGLSLDGKMGHAVPFNTKVKHADGRETWEKKAQFMPDWKGLVAVAKRTNTVADVIGDIVGANDEFSIVRTMGEDAVEHKPNVKSRGELIGAYVIIRLRGVPHRYEYMTREQIDHIRAKSKSKDNGPWVTDYDQMAVKTVIKRALKSYLDDPTLIRAIELDDAIDVEFESNATATKPKRVSYQSLALPAEVAPSEPAFQQPEQPETVEKPQPKQKPQAKAEPVNPYIAEFADCKDHREVVVRHGEIMSSPDGETDKELIDAAAAARKAELK